MNTLAKNIKAYADSLGTQGQIGLARLSLKLGKRLDAVGPADDQALRRIAQEIFGKSF